jgi:hypothetical protein
MCTSATGIQARQLHQVAPACSGSNCYTCGGGTAAAILNGASCSCSDGSECALVSGSGATPPPVFPVGYFPGMMATPGNVGGGDCPQHGEGQGGSRCGNVDLIGFCEDECGTGDRACCVKGDSGGWVPECNC